jgi:PAS domain-containing protein
MTNEDTQTRATDKEGEERESLDLLTSPKASYLLAAIIESAEDAIISKTLEGRITSWNNAAEKLFGYTAEEAVGKSVTMLIPSGHYDEEPGILAQIRAGTDQDTAIRMAAFEQVRRLSEVRDCLTAAELKPGFTFNGERIPLINPQRGIFKPRQMHFLLSIKTVFPKPGGKVWYDESATGTSPDLRG